MPRKRKAPKKTKVAQKQKQSQTVIVNIHKPTRAKSAPTPKPQPQTQHLGFSPQIITMYPAGIQSNPLTDMGIKTQAPKAEPVKEPVKETPYYHRSHNPEYTDDYLKDRLNSVHRNLQSQLFGAEEEAPLSSGSNLAAGGGLESVDDEDDSLSVVSDLTQNPPIERIFQPPNSQFRIINPQHEDMSDFVNSTAHSINNDEYAQDEDARSILSNLRHQRLRREAFYDGPGRPLQVFANEEDRLRHILNSTNKTKLIEIAKDRNINPYDNRGKGLSATQLIELIIASKMGMQKDFSV